jgi:hypothetical protein
MIPTKHVPDLTRDGKRFSDKIMRWLRVMKPLTHEH